MEDFLPTNFFEALGGGLAAVAVIAGGLSLCPCFRTHTLKLLAIFLVASLALFANHASTYFIAIFVIATGVTELEFLQNLAAIIRGNKDYFDYKKNQLSTADKLELLKRELAQAEAIAQSETINVDQSVTQAEDSTVSDSLHTAPSDVDTSVQAPRESAPPTDQAPQDIVEPKVTGVEDAGQGTHRVFKLSPREQDLMRVYQLESQALDRAELIFNSAIERGVLLRGKQTSIELDGLIPAGSGRTEDVVFEVKYVRTGRNLIMLLKHVGELVQRIKAVYKEITNKSVTVHVILIFEPGIVLTLRQRREIQALGSDVSIFQADQL